MPNYPKSVRELQEALDLSEEIRDALANHEYYSPLDDQRSIEPRAYNGELPKPDTSHLANDLPPGFLSSHFQSKNIEDIFESVDLNISPEEYELLLGTIGDLARKSIDNHLYLVSGNYANEGVDTLNFVVDRLNQRPDSYAFLMSDVPTNDLPLTVIFQLLTAYADTIIFVIEEISPWINIELKSINSDATLFNKTFIFMNNKIKNKINEGGSLQEDILQLIEKENRLYKWRNQNNLADILEEIP